MNRFAKDLLGTIRQSDWFDWCYLVYIAGVGVLGGWVASLLMDEFR